MAYSLLMMLRLIIPIVQWPLYTFVDLGIFVYNFLRYRLRYSCFAVTLHSMDIVFTYLPHLRDEYVMNMYSFFFHAVIIVYESICRHRIIMVIYYRGLRAFVLEAYANLTSNFSPFHVDCDLMMLTAVLMILVWFFVGQTHYAFCTCVSLSLNDRLYEN